MKLHWKLNALGIGIYVLITGWLLIASTVHTMILLDEGRSPLWSLVGVLLGGLMTVGMGFGRVHEHDEQGREEVAP